MLHATTAWSYEFCQSGYLFGCEIVCDEKTDDEIWEMAKRILAIPRNGLFASFLTTNPEREQRLKNEFFEQQYVHADPGQYGVLFTWGICSGKKMTVFFSHPYHSEIRELLGV